MCYPCTHCNKCGKFPLSGVCLSCGHERQPGESVCSHCGFEFPAPPGVPMDEAAACEEKDAGDSPLC